MKKILLSLACVMSLGFAASAQTYEATPFADLQTGDVVVVVDQNGKYAIPNAKATTNGSVKAVSVTLSDDNNTVTADNIDAFTFTVTKSDAGLAFASTADEANSLYCINNNNGVRVGSTTKDNVFTLSNDGYLYNVGQKRYVGVYNKQDWRCYTSVHDNIKATKIAFYKETASASTVYKPTFSPAAGEYYEAQNVEILCSTEGATIEYSFDNATWTAYTGPVTVDKSLTLYARASKDGVTAESSAAYVIKTLAKYASIAEMMSMELPAKGAKSDVFVVNFDATVVYQNGAYTYLYDGKDYTLYYIANSGLEKGNTLKAGWRAQISNYNNLYELIPVTTPEKGADVTTFPEPEVVDAAALTAENQSKYIKLQKVVIAEATPTTATAFTGTMGDATVNFYNRFTLAAAEPGTYDITGFIAVYNSTVQIYVVSFDEPAEDPEPEPVFTGKLTVAEDAPFELKIDWEQANPEDWALNIGRGATGRPNDKAVYVNAYTVNKIYKMDAKGVTEYMTTDGIGTSLASDNAGNLFWPAGVAGSNLQSHVFKVLPAGKASMDDVVTITCDEPGSAGAQRADNYGRALGDFFSEEGAMVYTTPSTATYVDAYWIKNGEAAEASTSLELPGANNTFQRAQPWATSVEEADATGAWDMCFYLYTANGNTIYYPNEDFDGFASVNRVDQRSAMAFDWFMLGGESYLVYGAKLPGKGATWCNGDIVIVRQSDNAIVASYEAAIENPSGQAYAGISCFPNEDNNSVTISVWNSRSGAYQLTATLPQEEVPALYAAYGGQGWNPGEPVEFNYADGIYSYTFAEGTGSFKMSTTKGVDANDWAGFEAGVICVADDKKIEDNTGETKYALYVGGNADIAFGYTEGQWTAYVDLANGLIWATNATDKPAASGKLYIVGIDGTFDAVNPTELAYDEAKKVFTIDVPAAPYGFKLSTEKGSWDAFNAAGFHTDGDIVPNVETPLYAGSPSGNMNTTATAPYTIEVAGDYSTITVVKAEEINVPASLAVIGELSAGKWNTTAVAPLTLKEDGYTYYGGVEMAGGWFSLCEKAGANANDWGGIGTRYGAATDGTKVEQDILVPFQPSSNAFDIISFSAYPMTVYFTVDFKEMKLMVSPNPTGVETIEADNDATAEYYNLQGIRVNEPVKGQLYIVRKGNEVSKIVR